MRSSTTTPLQLTGENPSYPVSSCFVPFCFALPLARFVIRPTSHYGFEVSSRKIGLSLSRDLLFILPLSFSICAPFFSFVCLFVHHLFPGIFLFLLRLLAYFSMRGHAERAGGLTFADTGLAAGWTRSPGRSRRRRCCKRVPGDPPLPPPPRIPHAPGSARAASERISLSLLPGSRPDTAY